MQNKLVFIILIFVCGAIKAQLSSAKLFQALIKKQPICQPLLFDRLRSGNNQSVDVYMLSRLLKELAKHPCVLITKSGADQDLISTLFPSAVVYVADSDEQVKKVMHQIYAFCNVRRDYMIICTNLGSACEAVRNAVPQNMPYLCNLAVDELFSLSDGKIDMPKLQRLMKRSIHVVCTAALIPDFYVRRQIQYIRSMQRLIDYGYYPYVVESCVVGPTFLDAYSRDVCYTRSNNATLRNKGVNESISLLKALEKWQFKDEDIVLKLTGRYLLQSDALLRLLEDDESIDALAKFEDIGWSSVLTGCFAMRCGLMKKMYASYDYKRLEREMICIEHAVGSSLDELEKLGMIKLIRAEHLGVQAYVFGNRSMKYW